MIALNPQLFASKHKIMNYFNIFLNCDDCGRSRHMLIFIRLSVMFKLLTSSFKYVIWYLIPISTK